MTEILSPSGIDLHPDPPATVRISKRAGLVALLALASVVGLILLGMYSRQRRQVEMSRRAVEEQKPTAGIAAVGFCSSTALLLISTCRRCLEYMPSSIRPTTLASASKATSPALLLMRTVAGGSGCRSIPDGDRISVIGRHPSLLLSSPEHLFQFCA